MRSNTAGRDGSGDLERQLQSDAEEARTMKETLRARRAAVGRVPEQSAREWTRRMSIWKR